MPADRVPTFYVDACVLLAFVDNEAGRAPIVEELLRRAHAGKVEVITSVLSIAEVAYGANELAGDLTDEVDARISELWVPASPVTLVDVSTALAVEARRLIREARALGFGIRSADALHLAGARIYQCDEFFTYEDRPRWSEVLGLPVRAPYVQQLTIDMQ